MADETTTVASTPEAAPTPTGQSEAPVESTSSEESKPTGNAGAQADSAPHREEAAPKSEPKKSVNLYELPEFRNVQSNWSKQLEQERQQRLALQQEVEKERLSKMNDFQKERYFRQQAEQRAQELEQRLTLSELRDAKQRDLKDLADLTGAPMEIFEGVDRLVDANMVAMKWMKENSEKAVKERVKAALESREANKPDTGGGAPKAPMSQREERFANASAQRNATAYVAALLSPDEDA